MPIRNEVERIAALGPLPGIDADEAVVAVHQSLLGAITSPVSDEEASVLAGLFGPDDCYGLAWTLLHLIESAPGGAPVTSEPTDADGEWLRLLWERSHR